MNAVKSIYNNAPNSIPVPKEFQHKSIEVIFLPVEDKKQSNDIGQYFGSIPDFPERAPQGLSEERESLE
jgi:hypothetical protein